MEATQSGNPSDICKTKPVYAVSGLYVYSMFCTIQNIVLQKCVFKHLKHKSIEFMRREESGIEFELSSKKGLQV